MGKASGKKEAKIGSVAHKLLRGLLIVVAALAVICGAVAALIFWALDPWNLSAPSDRTLIDTFHQNRAAFERLHQMAAEDAGRISYVSRSEIVGTISDTRKQEYKDLLPKIHSGLIVGMDYDSERFIFAHGALSAISGGWTKGIEYVPGDAKRFGVIVQNLDKANELSANVYLREIEPHWFIFYQSDDD